MVYSGNAESKLTVKNTGQRYQFGKEAGLIVAR